MKNNKLKAIERANKRLLERSGEVINEETYGFKIGTNVVTMKGRIKGRIVDVNYVINLENGKTIIMKKGEFYNNDGDDIDLPF